MRLYVGILIVAAAVVAGVIIVGSTEDEDPYPSYDSAQPIETSVQQVVNVTEQWFRKPVALTGTAQPIGEERFVLVGENASIVVIPEPDILDQPLTGGEEVTVSGIVQGFSRLQAAELQDLLDEGDTPQLENAPTELDDPFIAADYVVQD